MLPGRTKKYTRLSGQGKQLSEVIPGWTSDGVNPVWDEWDEESKCRNVVNITTVYCEYLMQKTESWEGELKAIALALEFIRNPDSGLVADREIPTEAWRDILKGCRPWLGLPRAAAGS